MKKVILTFILAFFSISIASASVEAPSAKTSNNCSLISELEFCALETFACVQYFGFTPNLEWVAFCTAAFISCNQCAFGYGNHQCFLDAHQTKANACVKSVEARIEKASQSCGDDASCVDALKQDYTKSIQNCVKAS